jgi:glycerol-1-phosphate dehydrogenase [NAD(P)+]
MSHPALTQALAKANDTREVLIESGALHQADAVLTRCFGDRAVGLIADDNTHAAAGEALEQHLRSAGRRIAVTHVFPGKPRLHPDIEHVDTLVKILGMDEVVPVAVGSGVINDLTKLAAHRLGRPYAVVGTAASMDGYTAFAAAITHQGVKMVDPCPAPRAFVADLDVIAAAPVGMSASGYGDLVGKYTALADWRIANELGIEAIEPISWQLMEQGLGPWTSQPERVRSGDREALRDLLEGLVIAGLAMQISSSTRAASGSEHLFSHLWEMQGLTYGNESVAHGIQVGLGTLAASSLLHWLIGRGLEDLTAEARDWPSAGQLEAEVRRAHPDPVQADQAVRESLAKHPSADQLSERLRRAKQVWPELRRFLLAWCPAPETLRGSLSAAGCPTTPGQIGLTRSRLCDSYILARQVRKRYTVLDLAVETGLLGPALDSLFSPQGFWGGDADP